MEKMMKKSFSTKIVSENPTKEKDEYKSYMDKKMNGSIFDKTMFLRKSNKKDVESYKKCDERFLISINVLGSSGSIKFVVNGDDSGAVVIERALKAYARQGRLPILGNDVNNFVLYRANAGFEAFKPSDAIGLNGVRNFVLCRNETNKPHMTEARAEVIDRKWSGWRVWLQKSLSLKMIAR